MRKPKCIYLVSEARYYTGEFHFRFAAFTQKEAERCCREDAFKGTAKGGFEHDEKLLCRRIEKITIREAKAKLEPMKSRNQVIRTTTF